MRVNNFSGFMESFGSYQKPVLATIKRIEFTDIYVWEQGTGEKINH